VLILRLNLGPDGAIANGGRPDTNFSGNPTQIRTYPVSRPKTKRDIYCVRKRDRVLRLPFMNPKQIVGGPLLAAIAALSTALLVQGCSTSPSTVRSPATSSTFTDTSGADEAAIRANSIAWSAAAKVKDKEKVLSFYSNDAVVFDDGGPVQTTAAERLAAWDNNPPDPNSTLSWKTTKVEVAKSGDMAYEYGAYQYVTTAKDGSVTTLPGKYVLVWKKQANGTWKVAIDIDNKDAIPHSQRP
jgi:ketosteroid isomerase-like protein